MHRIPRLHFSLIFLLSLLFAPLMAVAQGTQPQTITILPISDRSVDSAPFQVVAVSSAYLPITLTVSSGPATLSGRLLTLTGVGSIILTATQAGNTQYAPATAQATFASQQVPPSLAWSLTSVPYGTAVSSALLDATAAAPPVVDPSADTATVSTQLDSSVLDPGTLPLTIAMPPTYIANNAVFRYEGNSVGPSTVTADQFGIIAKGTPGATNPNYTIAFSCDCQQFEFLMQARNTAYRLWVDGAYTSPDATTLPDKSPSIAAVLVKFPDKRLRQVKIVNAGNAPFYAVNTANGDTLEPPQAPLGAKVMVLGDSWTVPTIVAPATPPAQDGLTGSGYAQMLGQYFGWNTWNDGVAGSGFTTGGTNTPGGTFQQRVVSDVCPNGFNAVVILGGMNDGAASEQSMQSAVSGTLAAIHSCVPDIPVYLYAPQFYMPPLDQAISAAVAGAAGTVGYTDLGAAGWFSGSPTNPGTGNEYLYVNNQNLTPLGHDFLADEVAYDLGQKFPGIVPQPYALMSSATLPGSFAYSVQAGAVLSTGVHTLSATFTPQDATDYATGTVTANLIVTQATTTTTLAASQANKIVTLTATVAPEISGTPTGSVTFYDGANAIGTAPLVNGVATAQFGQDVLPPAAYSITARYSGDVNFLPSSSSSLPVVNTPPDFSFTFANPQATVPPGSSTNVKVNITPVGGLVAALAVSCSGLPQNTTCTLGSTPPSINQNPFQANLEIAAFTPKAALNHTPSFPFGIPGQIALAGLLGSFGLWRRRHIWARALTLCLALGLLTSTLSGCGSTSAINYAPPGTYTVTVQLTATSANATVNGTTTISHSEPFTLVLP